MSNQIYQAIPKVMAAVGAIEKGRKNTTQNYAFRGIDDVFAAFQRPLIEAGIFYVPEVLAHEHESVPTKSGGTMNYTRLQVAYTFYASDGSSVRAVVAGEAMDSADKSTNKAMSAALKYALLQIFCVPVEQDDADLETHEMGERKPPAKVQNIQDRKSETKQPDDPKYKKYAETLWAHLGDLSVAGQLTREDADAVRPFMREAYRLNVPVEKAGAFAIGASTIEQDAKTKAIKATTNWQVATQTMREAA